MLIPDFKKSNGLWAKSQLIDGTKCHTISGSVWYGIMKRCDPKGAEQKRRNTYVGCTVSDEWLNFQNFADWYTTQVGYGRELQGKYLVDKDLLFEGNRVYSSTTCLLVPHNINTLFNSRKNFRGSFPVGVCWDKKIQKFRAAISVNMQTKHLGYFTNTQDAYYAYIRAKKNEVALWCDRILSGEVIVDSRLLDVLQKWEPEGYIT